MTWHVEAESSVADDAHSGTESKPLRSISEAMRRIKPGDTVIVGDGIYRETVTAPRLVSARAGSPATVVRARNPGKAILRGSDVISGWTSAGGGRYSVPWTGPEPQQVFVRGVPLQQIGGNVFGGYPERADHELRTVHAHEGGIWPGRRQREGDSLQPGEFRFDKDGKRLELRLPNTGAGAEAVEVSVRPYVFLAQDVEDLRVEGLVFEHANTSLLARQGAVKVFGRRNVVSGVRIRWMDAIGLQLFGVGSRLEQSVIEHCGQMGMNIRGRDHEVVGNRFLSNNTRGFNKWWEAGGVKAIGDEGLHHTTFRDNYFAFNAGDGLWIDWMNTHIRIEGNVAAYNTGFGIHYEASQFGQIVGNASYGNGQRGIYVFESSDTRVERNLVLANGLEGIVVADGERAKGNPALRPRRNAVAGNLVGWNQDVELMLSPPEDGGTSDGNMFLSTGPAGVISGWRSAANRPARGLAEWRTRSGMDRQSREWRAARPPALDKVLSERQLIGITELRAAVAGTMQGRHANE